MITGNATLVLDLGNSQSRMIVKYTVKDEVKTSSPIVFSNAFARVPEGYEVPDYILTGADLDDDTDTASYILEHKGQLFTSGYLAEREFSTSLMRPTANVVKYESLASELSIQVAFYKAMQYLASRLGTQVGNLDYIWKVVVCIPAIDFDQRGKMEALIRGIKELRFDLPEMMTTKLNIDEVQVLPESVAAFTAVLFDTSRKVRKDFRHLAQANVMVLDIGAGTSDYTILANGKMINETRDTVRKGGNNVQQRVNRALRAEGKSLNPAVVEAGVVSGQVKSGARTVDITSHVRKAKAQVAEEIVSELSASLQGIGYNLQDIEYLLVIGGGSLNGATESISVPIVENLRLQAPDLASVSLPSDLNARLMNVIGASILAK